MTWKDTFYKEHFAQAKTDMKYTMRIYMTNSAWRVTNVKQHTARENVSKLAYEQLCTLFDSDDTLSTNCNG